MGMRKKDNLVRLPIVAPPVVDEPKEHMRPPPPPQPPPRPRTVQIGPGLVFLIACLIMLVCANTLIYGIVTCLYDGQWGWAWHPQWFIVHIVVNVAFFAWLVAIAIEDAHNR